MKENDKVRIWLEDKVEANGGTWVTGTLKNVEYTIKIPLAFIEDGSKNNIEELDSIKSFIDWGYKVEKL